MSDVIARQVKAGVGVCFDMNFKIRRIAFGVAAAAVGSALLVVTLVSVKARMNDKIRRWQTPIDALQIGEDFGPLRVSKGFREAGDFASFTRYVAGQRMPRDRDKTLFSTCVNKIAFVYTDVSNRVTFKLVCDQ